MRQKESTKKRGPESKFTLLIFGGSQGAHPLNQAMEEALIHLRELKGRLRIIHQTGEKDYAEVKEAYRREGFEAEVYPFIHDMDRAYAAADLVLCRAGATSLFELMAMGKPAIVVPYPYAANDHQTLNAQTLVEAGAALMVANRDLSGVQLSRILRQVSTDPVRLQEMAERAAALAKPEAAEMIVNLCYEMVAHA
jgi:UDP-N-acetylglucosamine--N-acetylmuramyl-(pentapeptide) pyrophosphoryl-undecaprenol N-acetylglucosamine transferase